MRAFTEGSELCDAVRCLRAPAGRRKHTFRSRALGVVGGAKYTSTLDYILCSRKLRPQLRVARVSTPALATDHRMVRAVFIGPSMSEGGRSNRRRRAWKRLALCRDERLAGSSSVRAFVDCVIPKTEVERLVGRG